MWQNRPVRSKQLELDQYATDKVRNGYMPWYDQIFGDDFESVKCMLELGVHTGGSLELWRDYFPRATVIGIDADLTRCHCTDRTRIEVFEGSQVDAAFLRSVARQAAPDGFDLIIDDASHVAWQTAASFWTLFDYLRPGGYYVIEDWGTGYLPDWTDGKTAKQPSYEVSLLERIARRLDIHFRQRSHQHGMVGFVKKLIDEQGLRDLTRGKRKSPFASITITPGIAAVRKNPLE